MGTTRRQQIVRRKTLTLATWFLEGPLNSGQHARCVPIHTPVFKIGRSEKLALTLASPTVSSIHAEISQRDGRIVVRDLGSTNGTYVNGRRIAAPVTLTAGDLVHFAEVAYRVRRHTTESYAGTVQKDVCDRALALVQFDKLMTNGAVIPHFQPIVEVTSGRHHAYEAFARSHLFGLEMPAAMFSAAAELKQEVELSRMLRRKAVEASGPLPGRPRLFLNTHPAEMAAPGLLDSLRELRQQFPAQPIVLEIHEASITDSATVQKLLEKLRELEIGLAYDDFGAGQSRILELADAPPDYVKFDLSLIHEIHLASPPRRQVLGTLVQMVKGLGIEPLAEGIESAEEAEVCQDLGFEMAQGFFLGEPAPADHYAEVALAT